MAHDDVTLLPTQRPLAPADLDTFLEPLGEVESARLLTGGTFSAVQAVTLRGGQRLVVKTSVPLDSLPNGRTPLLGYEHDMLRSEHDFLVALQNVDGVPSPRVLTADFSGELGVQAIAMEWIPGTPWDRAVDTMSESANARAWRSVGAIMAAMHTVTAERFGYPAGAFALGGATWHECFSSVLRSAIADAEAWGVEVEPGRLEAALERGAWALEDVRTPRLVHNDLWYGNVLLDPASGLVYGVVDFERALFGDPLQDFCGSDSMNTGPLEHSLVAGFREAGGTVLHGRVPSESEATRLALYRLWAMTVQAVETVPRGFHGEWLTAHRERIVRNRAALFAQFGV